MLIKIIRTSTSTYRDFAVVKNSEQRYPLGSNTRTLLELPLEVTECDAVVILGGIPEEIMLKSLLARAHNPQLQLKRVLVFRPIKSDGRKNTSKYEMDPKYQHYSNLMSTGKIEIYTLPVTE